MDVFEKAQQQIEVLKSNVDRLRMQRESIDAQLMRSEKELGKLLSFLDTYRQLADDKPKEPDLGLTEHLVRALRARTRTGLNPKNIEVITEAYLRHAAPKRTPEIVAYLEERGCEIPSTNKEGYLAGVLSRSDKFVARRKLGGWFLTENDPEPGSSETPELPELENREYKGETPSAPTEGVSFTANQAAVTGGRESDDLI